MDITGLRLVGLTDVDLPIIGARPSDTYICKAVDGLGPPERDISITNKVYQGNLVQGREVVIRVGLNPNYKINQTSSQLRSNLYGLLNPGDEDHILVQLMYGDQLLAQTVGYIKRIEIVPFAEEPEVQLVIPCPSSYFTAPEDHVLTPESRTLFEILNPGDAPSGFYMSVEFNAAAPNWSIHRDGNPTKRMLFEYSFLSGDTLTFDTRENKLAMHVKRGSTTINLLGSLSRDSIWLKLHRGANRFQTSSHTFNWKEVRFLPHYWGI